LIYTGSKKAKKKIRLIKTGKYKGGEEYRMNYGIVNKANETKRRLEEKSITAEGLNEEESKILEANKQLEY
jgi:hypothetical protein